MKKKLSVLIPIFAVIVFFIMFQTVFLIGYVPSSSMEPTLKENSMILGLRPYGELKTGDIIIFKHDNRTLVKRIAAVGGETIAIGEVSYTVPEHCYFMLGDNSDDSFDSRYWEDPFINEKSVIAKLILPHWR